MTDWTTHELAARIDRVVERLDVLDQRTQALEDNVAAIVEGMGKLEGRLPSPDGVE